jgi:hypothetical protein
MPSWRGAQLKHMDTFYLYRKVLGLQWLAFRLLGLGFVSEIRGFTERNPNLRRRGLRIMIVKNTLDVSDPL